METKKKKRTSLHGRAHIQLSEFSLISLLIVFSTLEVSDPNPPLFTSGRPITCVSIPLLPVGLTFWGRPPICTELNWFLLLVICHVNLIIRQTEEPMRVEGNFLLSDMCYLYQTYNFTIIREKSESSLF